MAERSFGYPRQSSAHSYKLARSIYLQFMTSTPPFEGLIEPYRRIVAAWREQHKKRAYGGLWALSGFSFQTGVYLLSFYRNLVAERPLPSIEELSDTNTSSIPRVMGQSAIGGVPSHPGRFPGQRAEVVDREVIKSGTR